jgi:hypothetical protein
LDKWAFVIWNYKSVAKNILPTLFVATPKVAEIDITNYENKKLFIFNDQLHNLPYSFEKWLEPISDWTDFNILLNNAETSNNFSQNSDFETCNEIEEWLKAIWNWDYELRNENWILTSEQCTF